MKKQLNLELARGIAMSMADLNMTKADQFMDFISQNDWLSKECLEDIRQHALKAERIIALCLKLEEAKKQKKKTPDQKSEVSSGD